MQTKKSQAVQNIEDAKLAIFAQLEEVPTMLPKEIIEYM